MLIPQIALANGVCDALPDRADAILKRIDGGKCSAASGGGPQFVGEQYYGPDDTLLANTGDSWCSMGRIAWLDAVARHRLATAVDGPGCRDRATVGHLRGEFDRAVDFLVTEVRERTWLVERYGCDGAQQLNRTQGFFEYPSVTAMMIAHLRFGVDFGLSTITVAPFGARHAKAGFVFRPSLRNTGGVQFSRHGTRVIIDAPARLDAKGEILGIELRQVSPPSWRRRRRRRHRPLDIAGH